MLPGLREERWRAGGEAEGWEGEGERKRVRISTCMDMAAWR
jgi:hypothetical protein